MPEGAVFTESKGMDEKFVIRWLQNIFIQEDLSSHWKKRGCILHKDML